MPTIEPGDREEMLLAGILNGDTETNIEPGSRKEMLLKAILENGGGGGEPLIVNLEPATEEDGYIIAGADKTVHEIINALSSGRPAWINMTMGGIDAHVTISVTTDIDGDEYVYSKIVNPDGSVYVAWASPTEDAPYRWMIAQRYIKAGHTVEITDDGAGNLVSEQTLAEIYDWLDGGDDVTLQFFHPSYAGYIYDLPITARGTNGDNYFLAAQLVDPLSGALSLLYAMGSGSDVNWTMTAYPVSN